MEHDFSGRFSGKFPGARERLKRQSCFSWRNVPGEDLCSTSSKPSLIPVRSRISCPFCGEWNWFVQIYKITKIVLALWLAERSVCLRVCKHGCGVQLSGSSRANHGSTSLKKFLSSKLDKFTLFTHSFVGWNMENRYKEGESIFLRLSWHFKRQKSVFCEASFCKKRTDYACKTSWTRFCYW